MLAKFNARSDAYFKDSPINAFLYMDYEIAPHSHTFYEINIVLKGSGTHRIEDFHFNVSAGDVYVIPPSVVHSYTDTHNLDIYHILIQRDFFRQNRTEADKIPGFIQLIEIEPFLHRNFRETVFLHLSPSELSKIKADLLLIDDNCPFPMPDFAPLKIHTLWKLLYQMSHLLYTQMHSSRPKNLSKHEYAIIQALEYMHLNYGSKITIDTLCNETYLSRSTFLRCFSEVCRCTPIQYLNAYRCEKAREMLSDPRASKTDIANSCGFYDLSHMERTLKQYPHKK